MSTRMWNCLSPTVLRGQQGYNQQWEVKGPHEVPGNQTGFSHSWPKFNPQHPIWFLSAEPKRTPGHHRRWPLKTNQKNLLWFLPIQSIHCLLFLLSPKFLDWLINQWHLHFYIWEKFYNLHSYNLWWLFWRPLKVATLLGVLSPTLNFLATLYHLVGQT